MSRYGTPMIVYDGYYYGHKKDHKRLGRYWRCPLRNCRVTAILENDFSLKITGMHTHPPRIVEYEVRGDFRILENLFTNAENTYNY